MEYLTSKSVKSLRECSHDIQLLAWNLRKKIARIYQGNAQCFHKYSEEFFIHFGQHNDRCWLKLIWTYYCSVFMHSLASTNLWRYYTKWKSKSYSINFKMIKNLPTLFMCSLTCSLRWTYDAVYQNIAEKTPTNLLKKPCVFKILRVVTRSVALFDWYIYNVLFEWIRI